MTGGDRDGGAEAASAAYWRDGDVACVNDSDLVAGIAGGSHEFLDEAYSRHAASVYGLARRLCGPDRADDIVQEVFLRLWHSPQGFDTARGTLRNFLLMQARGRALDLLRSDDARRARETASLRRRNATGPHVDDLALSRLVGEQVWNLLCGLCDGERNAIVLAYFAGYSYREVADLLEEPEGTVKSRIRSGLYRLRGGLRDDTRTQIQRQKTSQLSAHVAS